MTDADGGPDLTEGQEYDGRYMFDRRTMLAGLGAAGAIGLAGCSGNSNRATDGTSTNTGTETTMQETETSMGTEDGSMHDDDEHGSMGNKIGSRFGYTMTATDETPPVEPDHTIELKTKPVENREIPEFYFEPTGLKIETGDTVKFQLNTPHHNVNAYHPEIGYKQRVPDGVSPFSSPILTAGDAWLYTFETEGVHDFMCAPHEIFGMVGRLVVGAPTGPGANPIGDAPGGKRTRPPEFTAKTVYQDPAMAPDNIDSAGSVSWNDIADKNKQLLLRPVEHGGSE